MKYNFNYKLLNILVILLIVFITLNILNFYSANINSIRYVISPLILSFFISYSFYPIIRLVNKKISYNKACVLVLSFITSILSLIIFFLYSSIKKQILALNYDFISFINNISFLNYDFKSHLISYLSIENGLHFLGYSYSFLIILVLVIVLIVYFSINMKNIRNNILKNELLKKIDKDLFNYYKGLYIIVLIEFFEHLILYFIIGHPYFLIIAFLAGIASIIPFVGALFLNVFALVSAYFVGSKLFILTAIILLILPFFNNYFLEPKIYHRTLNMSFISVILSCFIFGSILGVMGIILAIPLYIIIKNIFNYYCNKK